MHLMLWGAPFDAYDMDLNRLVYISDATRAMSSGEVRKLVELSKANNNQKGISGVLLYSGAHFMQVLEGDPKIVASLYTHICRDPRHTNHRQLTHKEAGYRLFPEWGMQLLTTDRALDLDRERIDKILLRLRISSDATAVTEAVALIQEFREQFLAA
jgi:hypothetical protein